MTTYDLELYNSLIEDIIFEDKLRMIEEKAIALENCEHVQKLNMSEESIIQVIGKDAYEFIKKIDVAQEYQKLNELCEDVLQPSTEGLRDEIAWCAAKLVTSVAGAGKALVDIGKLKHMLKSELKCCDMMHTVFDDETDHKYLDDILNVKVLSPDISKEKLSDNISKAYDLIKQGLSEKNKQKIHEAFSIIRSSTTLTVKQIKLREFYDAANKYLSRCYAPFVDVVSELNLDKLSRQYLGRAGIDSNDKYTTDPPENMRWVSIRRIQMYIASRLKMSASSFRLALISEIKKRGREDIVNSPRLSAVKHMITSL